MTRRLPSTAALLAFESAARHESFARAAQVLSLTEGAISRQVAKLEGFLGVRLFNRVSNRVELSAPGMRYADEMRELLERMERWEQYAGLSGMSLPNAASGPNYDRYSLLIDAACSGIGMALVPRLYVQEEIRLGRLSMPWPDVPDLAERFVLVTRSDRLATPAMQAFQQWLPEQIPGAASAYLNR